MKSDRCLVFEINFTHSILDPQAADDLMRLENFLTAAVKRKDPAILMLHKKVLPFDFSHQVISYLEHSALIDEVYIRFVRLYNMVRLIKEMPHPVIFVNEGHCMGFAFELALASSVFFQVGGEASIGFPEIRMGFFPSFFSFAEGCFQTRYSRKDWELQPVLSVREAQARGFCISADPVNWRMQVDAWIDQAGERKADKLKLLLPAQVKDEGSGFIDFFEQQTKRYAAGTHALGETRPWRLLWDSIREKEPQKTPAVFAHKMLFLSARFALSDVFLRWAGRNELLGQPTYTGRSLKKIGPAIIDLEYLVPPVQPLARLMNVGIPLVFCHTEPEKLKENLDLLYARFDRSFPKEQALSWWQKYVGWYQGDPPKRGNTLVMRWFPDDRLKISLGPGKTRTFLRFAGNRGNGACGWAEFATERDHQEIREDLCYQIMDCMSDGVIVSKRLADGKVSLANFVRSLFLDELIDVSKNYQNGLMRVLPALKEAGWDYVAEENSWEYFLRSREETFAVDAKTVSLGPISLDFQSWTIGIWKEAKEIARQHTGRKRSVNPAFLSRHFALFAGSLAQIIAREQLVSSAREADIFVGEALGFPESLGTPINFFNSLGSLRVKTYLKRVWPDWGGELLNRVDI